MMIHLLLASMALVEPTTFEYRVETRVTIGSASGGSASAWIAVPRDWAGQKVETTVQEFVRCKGKLQQTPPGATGLLVTTTRLKPGQQATARLVQKVLSTPQPRPDSKTFVGPGKADAKTKPFLEATAGVQSNDAAIKARAESAAKGSTSAWEEAQRLADFTHRHVQYQFGPFTSAKAAYDGKVGDCEELAALYVALCRARKIPARVVTAPGAKLTDSGHCWAEICLQTEAGDNEWLPVDVGLRFFGEFPNPCIIMSKGEGYRLAGGNPVTFQVQRWLKSNSGPMQIDFEQESTPVTEGALVDPTKYPRVADRKSASQ